MCYGETCLQISKVALNNLIRKFSEMIHRKNSQGCKQMVAFIDTCKDRGILRYREIKLLLMLSINSYVVV